MSKKLETLDGEWLPAVPTPLSRTGRVSIGLKKIEDVRMEMSRVYRECRNGKIDPSLGTKLTYILVQIGRMVEASELERRVEQLEQNSAGKSKNAD